MAGRTSLTVYEGMTGMSENVFINMKNRSHTITAEVEIPKGGANGVILAQARPVRRMEPVPEGRQADLHLQLAGSEALHDRRPSSRCLPGKATIRFEFAYDGGGIGKGGIGTHLRQREKGRQGTDRAHPSCVFSADEGADVGADEGTPVTEDYKVPFKFTGKIAAGNHRIEGNEEGRYATMPCTPARRRR